MLENDQVSQTGLLKSRSAFCIQRQISTFADDPTEMAGTIIGGCLKMETGEYPGEIPKEDPLMKKQNNTPRIGGSHTENPFLKARLNAGLSQEQAAEKLSCAPRTIQRYESGETAPDYPALCSMIDCYRCEPADLFDGRHLSRHSSGGDAK